MLNFEALELFDYNELRVFEILRFGVGNVDTNEMFGILFIFQGL